MYNSQKLYDSLKKLSLSQNLLELSNTRVGKNLVDSPIDSLINTWSGAVNFIIVEDKVLLIKRSEQMPTHKGQVAFVGGHKHDGELEPEQTAFRELEEEINIDKKHFEFLGLISGVHTSSQSKIIIPVLSYCRLTANELLKRVKSNGEWTDALLISFDFLENQKNWTHGNAIKGNNRFPILFCPMISGGYESSTGDNDVDHMLWGLTAKMIGNFFKIYSDSAIR